MTRQSLLVLELQQRVNMLRLRCFQCFVKTEADTFNYRHRRSLRLCHMPAWLFVTYDVWECHLFFSPSVRPVGESTERWQSVVAPPNTHAHWHTRTHLQLGLVFASCSAQLHFNATSKTSVQRMDLIIISHEAEVRLRVGPCCALALTLAFGGLTCHMMLNLDLQGAKKKKWTDWSDSSGIENST